VTLASPHPLHPDRSDADDPAAESPRGSRLFREAHSAAAGFKKIILPHLSNTAAKGYSRYPAGAELNRSIPKTAVQMGRGNPPAEPAAVQDRTTLL